MNKDATDIQNSGGGYTDIQVTNSKCKLWVEVKYLKHFQRYPVDEIVWKIQQT